MIKKYWKKALPLAIIVCVAFLIFGVFYTKLINIYYEKDFPVIDIDEEADNFVLVPGDVVTQSFTLTLPEITSIAVNIPGEQEADSIKGVDVRLSVYDANGALINEQVYKGKDMVNTFLISVNFPQVMLPGEYALSLEVMQTQETFEEPLEEPACIEICQGLIDEEDAASIAKAYKNEVSTEASLAINQRNFSWSQDTFKDFSLVVTIILVIAIIGIFVLLFYTKVEFHWCYMAIALVFGFLFMFVIPPYATPDEPMHISTALHISNQILGWETTDEEATYVARITEIDTKLNAYLDRDAYNSFFHSLSTPVNEHTEQLVDRPDAVTGIYSLYTIPAIGITIGRLLSLNGVATILLGTMFNMLCFVGMATYAIKKIPFAKMVLAGVCLLPISLQQISSFSYDNPVIWATAVVMALGLRWCYGKEKVKKNEVVLYLISSMVLIIGKGGVYCMYILLPFVYKFSKEKLSLLWNKYRIQSLAFAVGIVVVFLRNKILGIFESLFASKETTEIVVEQTAEHVGNYIEWAGAEGFTVMEFILNPLKLIRMIYNTMVTYMDFYLGTMIGNSLGWLDISIPWFLVVACILILFLATIKPAKETGEMVLVDKLIVDVFAIASCGLCLAAMLILWTPRTVNVIMGVQGRYFLPPFMAFLLTLRTSKLQINRNIDRELLYSMFMVGVLVIYYVLCASVLK